MDKLNFGPYMIDDWGGFGFYMDSHKMPGEYEYIGVDIVREVVLGSGPGWDSKIKFNSPLCNLIAATYNGEIRLLEELAMWFDNCDLEELSGKQVAQIIRKWRPE